MKKSILGIFVLIAVTFASCSKGPQGDPGPAGANGSANVTAYTFSVSNTAWNWSNANSWYYVTSGFSELTSDIVNNGNISVFISTDQNTYYPCPYTFFNSSIGVAGAESLCSYYYTVGNIGFTIGASDGGSFSINGTFYYKVVLIPATQRSTGGKTIDWHNYAQVMSLVTKEVSVPLK